MCKILKQYEDIARRRRSPLHHKLCKFCKLCSFSFFGTLTLPKGNVTPPGVSALPPKRTETAAVSERPALDLVGFGPPRPPGVSIRMSADRMKPAAPSAALSNIGAVSFGQRAAAPRFMQVRTLEGTIAFIISPPAGGVSP